MKTTRVLEREFYESEIRSQSGVKGFLQLSFSTSIRQRPDIHFGIKPNSLQIGPQVAGQQTPNIFGDEKQTILNYFLYYSKELPSGEEWALELEKIFANEPRDSELYTVLSQAENKVDAINKPENLKHRLDIIYRILAGYSFAGIKDSEDLVKPLRAENGSRTYLYLKNTSEGRRPYFIWTPGQKEPIEIRKEELNRLIREDKSFSNTLYAIYGPPDTRGVDLRLPAGRATLIGGEVVSIEDAVQALGRVREPHKMNVDFMLPESVADRAKAKEDDYAAWVGDVIDETVENKLAGERSQTVTTGYKMPFNLRLRQILACYSEIGSDQNEFKKLYEHIQKQDPDQGKTHLLEERKTYNPEAEKAPFERKPTEAVFNAVAQGEWKKIYELMKLHTPDLNQESFEQIKTQIINFEIETEKFSPQGLLIVQMVLDLHRREEATKELLKKGQLYPATLPTIGALASCSQKVTEQQKQVETQKQQQAVRKQQRMLRPQRFIEFDSIDDLAKSLKNSDELADKYSKNERERTIATIANKELSKTKTIKEKTYCKTEYYKQFCKDSKIKIKEIEEKICDSEIHLILRDGWETDYIQGKGDDLSQQPQFQRALRYSKLIMGGVGLTKQEKEVILSELKAAAPSVQDSFKAYAQYFGSKKMIDLAALL